MMSDLFTRHFTLYLKLMGDSMGLALAVNKAVLTSICGSVPIKGSGFMTTPTGVPDWSLTPTETSQTPQEILSQFWLDVGWPQNPNLNIANLEGITYHRQ